MSAPTYVKFILLKRNPKISHGEYNQHWHTLHADILSSLPSFWKYITAYVQNHILPAPECIGGQDLEFDGVAETTQRPRESIHDDFFRHPDYVNFVRPDELKLLSVSECVSLCTEQRVIKDGPVGGVKFMAFIRPKDGMSLEEFHAYWYEQHAALVKDIKPFWNLVQRYVQNHVRPELSSKMISDGRVEGYGGVVELWFKSVDDFVAGWTNPEYVARIRPDEAVFLKKPSTRFLVEEHPVAKPESLVA